MRHKGHSKIIVGILSIGEEQGTNIGRSSIGGSLTIELGLSSWSISNGVEVFTDIFGLAGVFGFLELSWGILRSGIIFRTFSIRGVLAGTFSGTFTASESLTGSLSFAFGLLFGLVLDSFFGLDFAGCVIGCDEGRFRRLEYITNPV